MPPPIPSSLPPEPVEKLAINYHRPKLYQGQKRAFFCEERYSFCEATTKSGKTVGCIAWIIEEALASKPYSNFWWIAPILSQSEIAFKRLIRALPPELISVNYMRMVITLPNKSCIWFKSGDNPDSLYGEDVYGAVMDEASRMKDEVWAAVRSTLTFTRGKVRIIGNVKGRKNWFYKLSRQAETGVLQDSVYTRLTCVDAVKAGLYDAKEIEDARRMLPEHVFQELYMAVASDDGGNPIGLKHIKRNTIDDLSHTEPYVWGWDLARTVDYTVGIALDTKGNVCRFERFQKPWQGTKATIQYETGQDVPCLIDSTGVGDAVVEDLQRVMNNVEGFKFTGLSKQQLIETLIVAFQQDLIKVPSGVIVQELENLEYEYTKGGVRYSAPEGLHDDCVMALALAVKKFMEPVDMPNIRSL